MSESTVSLRAADARRPADDHAVVRGPRHPPIPRRPGLARCDARARRPRGRRRCSAAPGRPALTTTSRSPTARLSATSTAARLTAAPSTAAKARTGRSSLETIDVADRVDRVRDRPRAARPRARSRDDRRAASRAPSSRVVELFEAGVEPENTAARRCLQAAGFRAALDRPDFEGMLYYRAWRRDARPDAADGIDVTIRIPPQLADAVDEDDYPERLRMAGRAPAGRRRDRDRAGSSSSASRICPAGSARGSRRPATRAARSWC